MSRAKETKRRRIRPWAKLWRYESPRFKALPARARMLASYLLKVVDDEGRLPMGHRDPVSAVALAIGADVGDRRWLRADVQQLLEHGYLAVDGANLLVANWPRWQDRDDADVTEPTAAPDTNTTRDEREPNASSTRDEREPDARIESSTRNDSLARDVLLSETGDRRQETGESPESGRGMDRLPAPTAETLALAGMRPPRLRPVAKPPAEAQAVREVIEAFESAWAAAHGSELGLTVSAEYQRGLEVHRWAAKSAPDDPIALVRRAAAAACANPEFASMQTPWAVFARSPGRHLVAVSSGQRQERAMRPATHHTAFKTDLSDLDALAAGEP